MTRPPGREPHQKNKSSVALPKIDIGKTGPKNFELDYSVNMTEENLENFQSLREDRTRDIAEDDKGTGPSFVDIKHILDGTTRIEMSHAGGEFVATLQEGIEEEVARSSTRKKSARDYRVRDDRTQNLVNAWEIQMDRLVTAYMTWCAEADLGSSRKTTPTMVEVIRITVVDLYESSMVDVELNAGGAGVPAALIMQGLVPCSPWTLTVAIATRLAIQAFVKSLCDLHGVPYRPYLREQFSIAYDLYLEIRRQTDARVNAALGRDTPNWRLKHTCPACMYKLEGEDTLIFSILTTMDGNDSLKRVLRHAKTDGSEQEPTLGPSKEREDSRDGGEDYFLTHEQVDKWAKGRVANILPTDADNPCSDRWKNMINDATSRMWGIFDETGIFLGLCRHGFVLVVADMVRSGELAKYPLAIVEVLLDAFGLKISGGYDIGCHFGTTLNNSELGDKARTNQFCSLVGSFHGHAHNRLCQLSFLATYVKGLGLEDLEGCEHYFSRSNGLAKSVHYTSKFHRRQEITTFMKQIDDFETYANLSKFICDNYRQALKILQTEPGLKRWMVEEGIDDYDTFHVWLEEEKDYLLGLDTGLPKKREETIKMEYVQKLVNLEASECEPAPISQVARRHAIEQRNRDLEQVQDLEARMGIESRWTSSDAEWIAAAAAIKNRKYQGALDSIEEIIVERLLEMTKIHQSGTGYKMRAHIAKALQSRSKGIRNAIERYNAVALSMDPPMPTLSWDEVVNFGFLAEFNLLRDTRDSVPSRPWTRRNYHLAMDSYFKILRAREEIKRLNIEIKCVVTWIDDEDLFLRKKEEEYKQSDPSLTFQISLYRQRRARSDTNHMHRFWALAKTPGFTGSVEPGVSVERKESMRQDQGATQSAGAEGEMDVDITVDQEDRWQQAQAGEWVEGDEGEDAEEETVSVLMYQMSVLAVDRSEGGRRDLDFE
ncbi:hypothetical protein K438DRAFT_1977033 [Mycena galopus ATCC 62051]|nr:hypothetical protein K438DRAFT_1977033 [Mycena galopus ATCC 62051]